MSVTAPVYHRSPSGCNVYLGRLPPLRPCRLQRSRTRPPVRQQRQQVEDADGAVANEVRRAERLAPRGRRCRRGCRRRRSTIRPAASLDRTHRRTRVRHRTLKHGEPRRTTERKKGFRILKPQASGLAPQASSPRPQAFLITLRPILKCTHGGIVAEYALGTPRLTCLLTLLGRVEVSVIEVGGLAPKTS